MPNTADIITLQSATRDMLAAARKAYPNVGDQAILAVCRATIEVELIVNPTLDAAD